MTAMILFSGAAAMLVLLAGRGDKARDPRLTGAALALLAVFPLLAAALPSLEILPAGNAVGRGFPWWKIVAGIWAAGCFLGIVRLIFAARTIGNWRKNSVLIRRSGRVEIRRLAGLSGPVAAGVARPLVFVPADWDRWPPTTRRIVLKHELVHHRRSDPLWRWIAEIACVVHGLNPLVLWISRRLVLQCEFACDARVLAAGVRPADYARLLCDLAASRPARGPVLAMASRSTLETRVARLIRPGRRGSALLLAVFLTALAAAAGILAALHPATPGNPAVSQSEAALRWSADPFPGGK